MKFVKDKIKVCMKTIKDITKNIQYLYKKLNILNENYIKNITTIKLYLKFLFLCYKCQY